MENTLSKKINLGSSNAAASEPSIRPGYSGVEDKSEPFHSFLEHGATYLFPLAFLATVLVSWGQLEELGLTWAIWMSLPVGWIISDFFSGLVHWGCDTYGSVDTPIFGQSLIKPFRLHHKYERDITTHNIVITIGNTCIAAVPLLFVMLAVLLSGPTNAGEAVTGLLISITAFGVVMTNQFHKWAHLEKRGKLLQFFQNLGIILHPDHHDHHHKAPHTSYYCITNGMLDGLLTKTRFFRGVEWVLAKFGFVARAKEE